MSALLIAAALGCFVVSGALAGPETTVAGGWQVLESHGGVRYRPVSERHWWPARTGSEIPDGSSITTGSSGFLIIARAGESITLRTNSRLELRSGPSGKKVRQTAGNLRYRITRAPARRFAVETPYLSLIVKGTVFDVEVSDLGAEVAVTQGRVRVDTPRGQVAELTPGQSARIAERPDAGLELRAGPESPFAAVLPPGGPIDAAYPRDDGEGTAIRRSDTADQGARRSEPAYSDRVVAGIGRGQVRVESQGEQGTRRISRQSASTARSASARLALRTAPEGRSGAAQSPSRSAAMAGARGDGIGSTDSSRAVGRSDQASPYSDHGASGAGVEITADGVRVDRPGPQVVELSPGQSPQVATGADADPESGGGRESMVAATPPPSRSIATAEAPDNGSTDSQGRDAPDQASDRSDEASSGGGTGDRVAVAALVLVLLVAVVWWRRQRQMTVGSSDRGRWPWQQPRVEASPGASSNGPSSASIREGTRRSTSHARL